MPWSIMKSKILSLSVLCLWVQGITAQIFENGGVSVDYPGISESCKHALNTTVQKCPSFLGDVSEDNPRLISAQLSELCTSDCQTSLTDVRKTIVSGCKKTDVITYEGADWPATLMIDRFLYTYRLSCRKDSSTGQFCDEIFTSWLNQSHLTAPQNCSDCMLGMMQTQLNSPFGYVDTFAGEFNSTTKSCTATGYAFTSPAPYAVNSSSTAPSDPNPTPLCAEPYRVQKNDTCESIALAHNVSTNALISAGGLSPGCENLQAVGSICLPAKCELYRVEYDETCEDIVDKHPGLSVMNLLNWNPNIYMVCGNIRALGNTFICVGPPGGRLPQPTTTTSSQPTSSDETSKVPKPTNAPPESNPRCAKWYVIKEGDYCDKISIRNGISLKDFHFLNPEVNTTCGNLMLGIAYCVQPVGDISTYKGYPTTKPIYTLPPISYSTTADTLPSAPAPVITPITSLPHAPGTKADCKEYVEYYPVPSLEERAAAQKAFGVSESINGCYHVLASYEISMKDFLAWNPSLRGVEPCMLQKGSSYCAKDRADGGNTTSSSQGRAGSSALPTSMQLIHH